MPAPIEVVPYDPIWPRRFDDVAAALRPAVDGLAIAVEHVGSTSVPGLAAKPIIDIDIVIDTRDDLPATVDRLSTLGYTHNGDQGCPGREAFKFDADTVPRDGSGRRRPYHHLYVCDKDNIYYRRHIAFRDYLRAHPDVAAQYGRLKLDLAITHRDDRVAYTEAKTEFVFRVYHLAGIED